MTSSKRYTLAQIEAAFLAWYVELFTSDGEISFNDFEKHLQAQRGRYGPRPGNRRGGKPKGYKKSVGKEE